MRTPELAKPRKDGTVRWKVRYRVNGVETSKHFTQKKHAETFAALMGDGDPRRIQDAIDWVDRMNGGASKPAALTFATWFEEYVNQLTGVTSRTRDDYRNIHRRYLTHLDSLPLEHITRTHVTAIVNNMETRGLSPKTIKNTVHMLSACLALAVDEGHLVRNPTKRVRLPRQQHDVDERSIFLTYDEFAQLYTATPDHYKPLVAFLVGTGLRWSEATALQWRHVNLDAGTLVVRQAWKRIQGGWELGPPKTPMARRTVNPATMALVSLKPLMTNIRPEQFVFTTPFGNVVRHGNFYSRIWAPAVTRSGLDPRPKIKDLRSTHASWLISDGVRLEAVQAQLGHESYETTRKVYAHLLPAVGVEVGRAASAAMERALGTTPSPEALAIEAARQVAEEAADAVGMVLVHPDDAP